MNLYSNYYLLVALMWVLSM